MKTSKIRQNKATRQWVIYAPARRRRPKDFRKSDLKKEIPPHDKRCPFCHNNEHMLTPIISDITDAGGDWKVRTIPNKFPALTPHDDLKRVNKGIYISMKGYGQHEVVIETPVHNRQIGQMSVKEVGLIIEMYHKRYTDLMKKHKNMMVIIFRNHGMQAGTSLIHPHSQIIATGMVPHHVRWREEEALHYFDEWGRCVFCDILKFEMQFAKRIIYKNKSFIAFVPYAAEVPFEIWIMPVKHRAEFRDISDTEKMNLASALKIVLEKLHKKLNDPDYNYIINTSAQYRAKEPQLHWYLQILPRLMTRAGFEIGSGININPSIPEEDAIFLKSGRS
jgi:UDPglucose--hexose-1-phosphate uridylyltransferase